MEDKQKYWHIQMHLSKTQGGDPMTPLKMLQEPHPVIGAGDASVRQCQVFRRMPPGAIILVRMGNKAIALCRVIGDSFHSDVLRGKYLHSNYRPVEVLSFVSPEDQPPSKLFSQGILRYVSSSTPQGQYIEKLFTAISKEG